MNRPPAQMPAPSAQRSFEIVVIGDAVLDRYVLARPTRLSREAPVPVFAEQSVRDSPGGAANVAFNLTALGAKPLLAAALGSDAEGLRLAQLLRARGLGDRGLEFVEHWTTPLKTRVLAAESHRTPAQVLRLDREPPAPVRLDQLPSLDALVTPEFIERSDAVIVSDYGYGTARALQKRAGAAALLVCDPRWPLEPVQGATALTPNLDDLARFAGREPRELDDLGSVAEAAACMRERFGARWLLATLGNRGMLLLDGEGRVLHVPAAGPRRVVDVSGAGDTAVAAFTLALAQGIDAGAAMAYANAAAGTVVMREGTSVPDADELEIALAVAPRPRTLEGTGPIGSVGSVAGRSDDGSVGARRTAAHGDAVENTAENAGGGADVLRPMPAPASPTRTAAGTHSARMPSAARTTDPEPRP